MNNSNLNDRKNKNIKIQLLSSACRNIRLCQASNKNKGLALYYNVKLVLVYKNYIYKLLVF